MGLENHAGAWVGFFKRNVFVIQIILNGLALPKKQANVFQTLEIIFGIQCEWLGKKIRKKKILIS